MEKQSRQKQPDPAGSGEEGGFEEEINLADYFRVLWKRKLVIILGSILPALSVGLVLLVWPSRFEVTYVYDVRDRGVYDAPQVDSSESKEDEGGDFGKGAISDVAKWNLDQRNYNMLLDRFYSGKNVAVIVENLRAKGLDGYAARWSSASTKEALAKLVDFEVLPAYVDASQAKITDPGKLEQLRRLEAQLLKMTITGRPKSDMPAIVSVIRENFEKVVPVRAAARAVSETIGVYKAKMGGIEENRFGSELALRTNESILAKLKAVETASKDEGPSDVVLQFNVGSKSEYLPLEYQIQAVQSKIVELEEKLKADEEKYSYYEDLLTLNEKLLAWLTSETSVCHTIQEFHSLLQGLADKCEAKELKDYMSSYAKQIENRMSAGVPVTEEPKVYPVPKGTAKKSAIVLLVCLMISVFAAFLIEGLQKSGPAGA
ncbi:MAG TPA: hypothetical protein VMX13_01450 [Sedimentisphaerales bacterium]|nr:hypothetical protein [Sedimentisphaerales bacterium]